ncbi:ParA family protein [Escherichia coli]
MTVAIALVNGKGGVKKSSMSRAIATEYTKADWKVLGLDMDVDQGSFLDWGQRRLRYKVEPPVTIQGCGTVSQAKKHIESGIWDLVVIDSAAYATKSLLSLAEIVDLLVLPSGFSVDDLRTTVTTVNALRNKGHSTNKMAVVFVGVSESESEYRTALEYLKPCGVQVINGAIPFMTSFSQAQDKGLALTESPFLGPRQKADEVVQGVIDLLTKLSQ